MTDDQRAQARALMKELRHRLGELGLDMVCVAYSTESHGDQTAFDMALAASVDAPDVCEVCLLVAQGASSEEVAEVELSPEDLASGRTLN